MISTSKKIITGIFLLLVCCLLPGITGKAEGNTLYSIHMEINIEEDGSAEIQEVWDIDVEEGTEIYKEMQGMEGSPITDLKVQEGDEIFESQGSWDTTVSFEEKAHKSGILQRGDDYELCFGVGSYGRHTFTMTYQIENFVDQYEDMSGMNYRLLNEGMSVMPEDFSLRINCILFREETKVYAFGFEGEIQVKQNEDASYYIEASNKNSEGEQGRIQYVNVLAGFQGAEFSGGNERHSDRNFQDMVDEAKEGSDYGDGGVNVGRIIRILICFIFTAVIFLRAYFKSPKNKLAALEFSDGTKGLPKESEVNYFRDIPAEKDLFLFYYIIRTGNVVSEKEAQSGLLTALLLNWIRQKKVEFVKEEVQGFIKKKESYEIHFLSDGSDLLTPMERELYDYFKKAAGSNGILENKEFEKWCRKNYTKMEAWFDNAISTVEGTLEGRGYALTRQEEDKFLGLFKYTRNKRLFTPAFKDLVLQSVGFKKFLKEFSSLGEKQVKEIVLWEDYLVFASVLGMADQVEKEIGRLYPEFNQYSEIDPYYTMMATRSFAIGGVTRMHAASEAARSSGGGGSSSFGGGGGSFSGGGGGGVR